MNKPTYNVEFISSKDQYIFESIGAKGSILKVVMFTEIQSNIYNLGFGDYDIKTNIINDTSISDNGDIIKVLSTVINIADDFLTKNPFCSIYFEGSTPLRTQLYQRILNNYFDEFSDYFEIYGYIEERPELFQNNKTYKSFLIKKNF